MKTPTIRGTLTYAEILQQPDLWPDTVDRVRAWRFREQLQHARVILSGAGTSAYAASAIEAAWPGARAIPSTDLLVDRSGCDGFDAMISLARSGDSPESVAVIDRVSTLRQFAITCNPDGALARKLGDSTLVLDPRSNDRSLVMTSSFSNLTFAGLCLRHLAALQDTVAAVAGRVRNSLPEIEAAAVQIAANHPQRAVVLASPSLGGLTQEACLKILEMTAGRVVAMPETFLGLRHGPMSFLRRDTLVLAWLSSDPLRRRYEEDLLAELRSKRLGFVVCIGTPLAGSDLADLSLPAAAPDLPDTLRTPFEIAIAQLTAYHLSLRADLDPDSPSPDGVITRVVQGVRMHG